MNNNTSGKRKLSVYERNQLLKYGLSETALLSKGEMPVEYLTGWVNFKNLEIKVSPAVLIPRVETEDLVDLVLADLEKNQAAAFNYLELGTGSGAISLALAKNLLLRRAKLTLLDFSKAALAVAEENFANLFPELKINFIASDLLANLPQEKYLYLVANLPYIPTGEMKHLASSVKDFEPSLALDGGADGFKLIERFLSQLLEGDYLMPGAKIFLEIDCSHDEKFVKSKHPALMANFESVWHQDHLGRNRFLILTFKNN